MKFRNINYDGLSMWICYQIHVILPHQSHYIFCMTNMNTLFCPSPIIIILFGETYVGITILWKTYFYNFRNHL